MDQVFRQLLQFPLEDIAMIAKSAYHVRNWLDNNCIRRSADTQEPAY